MKPRTERLIHILAQLNYTAEEGHACMLLKQRRYPFHTSGTQLARACSNTCRCLLPSVNHLCSQSTNSKTVQYGYPTRNRYATSRIDKSRRCASASVIAASIAGWRPCNRRISSSVAQCISWYHPLMCLSDGVGNGGYIVWLVAHEVVSTPLPPSWGVRCVSSTR